MNGEGAERRALAAGVLIMLLWGAAFSIQKSVYAAMGPGAFLFARSLVMAACAVVLLRWRGSPLWPPLQRREWPMLLGCTVIGPVVHIVLVTYGIHWSTPFSSALIMACGPVFTLLLLRLVRGTRLVAHQALGVAVAFCGVLVFMSDKLMGADWRASGGDLMMLCATVIFSLYTIWITPLVQRHGGPEVMCWVTLLATPLLALLSMPAALATRYGDFGLGTWTGFFWTVMVSAFLGWMLWSWVNAVRGVARSAPLLYGVPPVAGLVAWLTLGEGFTGIKLAGAAVALAGVAWTQRRAPPSSTG